MRKTTMEEDEREVMEPEIKGKSFTPLVCCLELLNIH